MHFMSLYNVGLDINAPGFESFKTAMRDAIFIPDINDMRAICHVLRTHPDFGVKYQSYADEALEAEAVRTRQIRPAFFLLSFGVNWPGTRTARLVV